MNEEPKRRPGRPSLPAGARGKRVLVYMAPDVEQWLKSQPGGMSKTIATLVREKMGLDQITATDRTNGAP